MPAPGERSRAKLAGKATYFTGVACPHGHVTERYTGSGACIGCRRARQAADGFHEKHREACKRSYHKNRDKVLKYGRAYYARNRDKVKAWKDDWRLRNMDKFRAYVINRRSKIAAGGGELSASAIQGIIVRQKGKCAACGGRAKLEMDHILPLALGGGGGVGNFQGLCGYCNRSKSAKHPVDFNRSLGLLL